MRKDNIYIGKSVKAWRVLLFFTFHFSLFIFMACSPHEDNVFGASPAERQQQAIEKYRALLTSKSDGWAMDFYPSDLVLGGIAYTARFVGDEVELSSEMLIDNAKGDKKKYAAGQVVKSEYHVIAGQGVMLTFDTYNPLMHYWSQPSGTNSEGLATDYEFMFVSASDDEIVLRGRKYGNLLRLYPLQESASTYINDVIQMRTTLSSIPRKRAVVDGKSVNVTVMSSHFQYTEDGADKDIPYIYTPTGIRFYQPITIAGVTESELTFDTTSHDLTSPDGRMQLPLPTPLEQFCGTVTQWHFIYGTTDAKYDMCDELREIVKTAIQRTTKENNENVDDIYIGMNKQNIEDDAQRMVIGWSTSTSMVGVWYELRYGLDMMVADEDNMVIDIRILDGGLYTNNYPQFTPMLDFIRNNTPFQMQFDNIQNPQYVKAVSVADAEKWFALKL